MFSVVLVKCRDWVFICELRVSTVSTKCEIAILQCQNTNYIWAVLFLFIGKDIQVFLVFRISAFCSWSCWTGNLHKISIFFAIKVHFCWTLNCQMFPNSAGTCPLYRTKRLSGTNFWNSDSPLWDRMLVKWYHLKELFGFFPSWKDLLCEPRKKKKHKSWD